MDVVLNLIKDCDYLGLGSGPHIKLLIDKLALNREFKPVLICSSAELAKYARLQGFYVQSWNNAQCIPIFVDEVDYVTTQGWCSFGSDGLIKERKILRPLVKELIAIVPESHYIDSFTGHEFYAEVISQSSSIVARQFLHLGGVLSYIDKFTVDHHWLMSFFFQKEWDFKTMLPSLDSISGLVEHGLSDRPVDRAITYAQGSDSFDVKNFS